MNRSGYLVFKLISQKHFILQIGVEMMTIPSAKVLVSELNWHDEISHVDTA